VGTSRVHPIEADPYEAQYEAVTLSPELISLARDIPTAEHALRAAAPPLVATDQELRVAVQLLAKVVVGQLQ
ncbi:hypothetical protein HAX54_045538, partial [Datura stramonium]|nr:hypothetical protein [Datura stramonium]